MSDNHLGRADNQLGRWGWTEDGHARLEGTPLGLKLILEIVLVAAGLGKHGISALTTEDPGLGLQTHHRPEIEEYT